MSHARLAHMTELSLESIADERVHVGDGISIATSWDAVVTGEPGIAGAVRIHARYDTQLRRAVAATVRVDREREGDEVTALTLREVRVQAVVAASALRLVTVSRDGEAAIPLADYLNEVQATVERTTADAIAEAVVLYRVASTVSFPPLKFVADNLDVSVSTATRMMARARQEGLAADLITRETYNRMQEERLRASAPYQPPGASPGGPSLGR